MLKVHLLFPDIHANFCHRSSKCKKKHAECLKHDIIITRTEASEN